MTEDLITRTDEERKPTILFVDDYKGLLDRYRELAEDKGYEVTTAISAREALQYTDRYFDVAIFDGLNGDCFDLYEKISGKRKIIMTLNDEILRRAKKRNIEAYDKNRIDELYNLLQR